MSQSNVIQSGGPIGVRRSVGHVDSAATEIDGPCIIHLYITGPAARILHRASRQGKLIRLQPSDVSVIEPPRIKWARSHSFGLEGLRSVLGPIGDRTLDIRVPTQESRLRVQGLRSHVCKIELPEGSFMRIDPINPSFALADKRRIELLVDSAPLWFMESAQRLTVLVSQHKITYHEACHWLLKLAVEDCSTYVLDPWFPTERDAAYDVPPVMTPESLCAYVGQLHKMKGIGIAREVCQLAFAGAASPMEAFLAAAISLPPHLGGIGLDSPELNRPLDLEEVQHGILNHTVSLKPDLSWPELRIVIEYLGNEPHTGKKAHDEDAGRIQDYMTLRQIAFPLRFKHVRDATAFNQFAMRLAEAMEQRGRTGTLAWVKELVGDKDFLVRQRTLFKVWLPAVDIQE